MDQADRDYSPERNRMRANRSWEESQRRDFMISCVIAGVCGLVCWGFGFVGSFAFFLGQFGILGSIPAPLIQLAVGIGFGIAGRYGVEYGLLASIYVMGILSESLRKLNHWLKTPKAHYVEDSKILQTEVERQKIRATLRYENANTLNESLDKLENLYNDAEFNTQGQLTENSPSFTKLNLYAWELEKFDAIRDGNLDYNQFQQEVNDVIQDPSKLKVVAPGH